MNINTKYLKYLIDIFIIMNIIARSFELRNKNGLLIMKHVVCIVGNKLTYFCQNNDHVKTVDDFTDYLHGVITKQYRCTEKLTAIIGQGVSDAQIKHLNALVYENKLATHVHIHISVERKNKTPNNLTHKRKSKNTMISVPARLKENIFESYLTLDDQCAEMSDHITGQHLQGMILIEAARQMTLAVTELFFLTAKNRENVSFITHNLETDFNEYVFPLDVKLRYEIINYRNAGSNNAKFHVHIICIQEEKIKMKIKYAFSIIQKQILYKKEKLLANESLNYFLKQAGE